MDPEVEKVLALLREMAGPDRKAPPQGEFQIVARQHGCRSLQFFFNRGLLYSDLVQMAGLRPRRRHYRKGMDGPPPEAEAEADLMSGGQVHRLTQMRINGRTWIWTGRCWSSPTLPVCRSYVAPDGRIVHVLR